MDVFATVKSAFPSVVTHSGALEFHSLFCTVYAPPATAAVWELHKVVVAACAGAAAKTPDAASIATAARMGMSLCLESFTRVFLLSGGSGCAVGRDRRCPRRRSSTLASS